MDCHFCGSDAHGTDACLTGNAHRQAVALERIADALERLANRESPRVKAEIDAKPFDGESWNEMRVRLAQRGAA